MPRANKRKTVLKDAKDISKITIKKEVKREIKTEPMDEAEKVLKESNNE